MLSLKDAGFLSRLKKQGLDIVKEWDNLLFRSGFLHQSINGIHIRDGVIVDFGKDGGVWPDWYHNLFRSLCVWHFIIHRNLDGNCPSAIPLALF